MKELTIEEKAQRYDEAIERAKNYHSPETECNVRIAMENLFPELAESEDVKIRKEIKQFIRSRGMSLAQSKVDSWIAWLEKQGGHANFRNKIQIGDKVTRNEDGVLVNLSQLKRIAKPTENKGKHSMGISEATKQKLEDNLNKALEKETSESWDKFLDEQGKQKSADKIDPKFKVGDWVVSPNGVYWHIDKISNNRYEVTSNTGESSDWNLDTNIYHKFTIQDAKDGDMLATDSWLFMFKYTNNKALIQFHCKCPINGTPYKWCWLSDDSYLDIYIDANIHPATKEQRDLLFQKMHDAGYEWDADKKELKKIEQKPVEPTDLRTWKYIVDAVLTEREGIGQYIDSPWTTEVAEKLQKRFGNIEQKPAEWSEEDEKTIHLACEFIRHHSNRNDSINGIDCPILIERLKSLRPQSTWKPSEEQLDSLRIAIGDEQGSDCCGMLRSLLKDLKSL